METGGCAECHPFVCTNAMSTDEDVSPYELLGVELEATDADIRKAYRTRSLKVHPDRVSLAAITDHC